MTIQEEAKLCDAINSIENGLAQMKQILLDSEEAYLARTDHICKCKECGKHDEYHHSNG